ncbi:MAG: FadR/GntR family transcriptional regulator [Desulfonatronovibrionaceae bacterium]
MTENNNLSFAPAKAGRASEDIALQIEAAIIEGRILPGQRLPSEREMQTQFKTGRGVIREAQQILKQKGLLEIKKGSKGGAFVKQVEVDSVSESFTLFLKQKNIDPESLIEFRESLDRTITTLAVARGSKKEKQALVEKTQELEKYVSTKSPDMQTIAELDRALNIQFAKMAKNPVFEWVMRAIQQGFSSYDYALYDDVDYREMTVSNWKETAREIDRGEPLKALTYIGNHYLMLLKCVQENNGDLPNRKSFLDNPKINHK